jgi:nucleotide-binding universal stress UspA family protein
MALLLAKTYRAHSEILFIRESAQVALRAATLAEEARFAAQEFAENLEREQEKAEKLARQKFDDLLAQHRIDYQEYALPADLPTAYWRVVEGVATEEIELNGAAYDLIVAARSADNVASRPLIEAALFGTGCPVLVAPPTAPTVIGENIMIGWNRGVPAARVVRFAMPFLGVAARVEIFSVDTGAKKGTSAQDIARYLAWRDIKTELNSVPPDQRSVGEMLLSEAETSGADLLVIGAFSHSRLREMILGGVTKHILERAELPVLMAH